jgi:hypothetical protein
MTLDRMNAILKRLRPAAVVALAALLVADVALGAGVQATQPPEVGYAIPNIAAILMSLTLLAVPCKRFRRT